MIIDAVENYTCREGNNHEYIVSVAKIEQQELLLQRQFRDQVLTETVNSFWLRHSAGCLSTASLPPGSAAV